MSTALTEEALSECLKRSIYESAAPEDAAVDCSENKDDVKCSICQVFFPIIATSFTSKNTGSFVRFACN